MSAKVIINSDDYGYSRSVNFGIIDSYKDGVLTSGTLMANMPGFDHAIELKRANPDFGVGIHLVLTCQSPLLKTHKHIVKEDGTFYHVRDYSSGAIEITDEVLAEIAAEYRAQIDKVYATGIDVTHFDSHHHMHMFDPRITEIVEKLAREKNVPVRSLGQDPERRVADDIPQVDFFEHRFDEIGEGYMTNEEIESYYDEVLETIKKYDVVEIMTHPGYLDQLVLSTSALNKARAYEVEALTTSSFAERLKNDPDIELVTYDVLHK